MPSLDLRPLFDQVGLRQVIDQVGLDQLIETAGSNQVIGALLARLTPEEIEELKRKLQ